MKSDAFRKWAKARGFRCRRAKAGARFLTEGEWFVPLEKRRGFLWDMSEDGPLKVGFMVSGGKTLMTRLDREILLTPGLRISQGSEDAICGILTDVSMSFDATAVLRPLRIPRSAPVSPEQRENLRLGRGKKAPVSPEGMETRP